MPPLPPYPPLPTMLVPLRRFDDMQRLTLAIGTSTWPTRQWQSSRNGYWMPRVTFFLNMIRHEIIFIDHEALAIFTTINDDSNQICTVILGVMYCQLLGSGSRWLGFNDTDWDHDFQLTNVWWAITTNQPTEAIHCQWQGLEMLKAATKNGNPKVLDEACGFKPRKQSPGTSEAGRS